MPYAEAQALCQQFPQQHWGSLPMPITDSDWLDLQTYTLNISIKDFWLSAQFANYSNADWDWSNINLMIGNQSCGSLTYLPSGVKLATDNKPNETAVLVKDPKKSPIDWTNEKPTNVHNTVCTFGQYIQYSQRIKQCKQRLENLTISQYPTLAFVFHLGSYSDFFA